MARLHGRATLGPIAIAILTLAVAGKLEGLPYTPCCLQQIDRYLALDVRTTPNPAATPTTTKDIAKNSAAKHVAKGLKDISDILKAGTACLQARMSIAIVTCAFFSIAEYFKSFSCFFKPSNRFLIIGIFIWVVLDR
jgi:hypothetical protein